MWDTNTQALLRSLAYVFAPHIWKLCVNDMFSNKLDPEKIKAKNTKQLKKLGIDVIDHLPWIEIKKQRADPDIAKRWITMSALLQLHFNAPREFICNYLKKNELLSEVSDAEQIYIETDYSEINEQLQINLNWSIEAIWALAWVGGFHEKLTFNTGVENSLASFLPDFHELESAEKYIKKFRARKQKVVFVELDRFYRAHWYARNLQLEGKSSNKVNLSIIMERRRALEWVSNSFEVWDEISLDT